MTPRQIAADPVMLAQMFSDVEFGDFGTFGGNVSSNLSDALELLTKTKKELFVEHFLAEMRIRLLDPDAPLPPRRYSGNPRI